MKPAFSNAWTQDPHLRSKRRIIFCTVPKPDNSSRSFLNPLVIGCRPVELATFREKIYIRWCCIDQLSWHRLSGPNMRRDCPTAPFFPVFTTSGRSAAFAGFCELRVSASRAPGRRISGRFRSRVRCSPLQKRYSGIVSKAGIWWRKSPHHAASSFAQHIGFTSA